MNIAVNHGILKGIARQNAVLRYEYTVGQRTVTIVQITDRAADLAVEVTLVDDVSPAGGRGLEFAVNIRVVIVTTCRKGGEACHQKRNEVKKLFHCN